MPIRRPTFVSNQSRAGMSVQTTFTTPRERLVLWKVGRLVTLRSISSKIRSVWAANILSKRSRSISSISPVSGIWTIAMSNTDFVKTSADLATGWVSGVSLTSNRFRGVCSEGVPSGQRRFEAAPLSAGVVFCALSSTLMRPSDFRPPLEAAGPLLKRGLRGDSPCDKENGWVRQLEMFPSKFDGPLPDDDVLSAFGSSSSQAPPPSEWSPPRR